MRRLEFAFLACSGALMVGSVMADQPATVMLSCEAGLASWAGGSCDEGTPTTELFRECGACSAPGSGTPSCTGQASGSCYPFGEPPSLDLSANKCCVKVVTKCNGNVVGTSQACCGGCG